MFSEQGVKIIRCDKCEGQDDCPYCLGHQNYIFLGKYLIYWNKEYNDLSVGIDRTNKFIKIFINVILFLIVIVGLASLGYHIYLLVINSADLLFLDNWQGKYLFIFWLSLVFNMFLFYRIQRSSSHLEKVVGSHDLVSSEDVISFKKIKEKNIYDALSKTSRKIIINSWFIAKKNRHILISPLDLLLAVLDNSEIILILNRLGIDKKVFQEKIKKLMKTTRLSYDNLDNLEVTMFNSYWFANQSRSKYIRVSDILKALVCTNEYVIDLFLDSGVDYEQVMNVLMWIKLGDELRERYKRYKSRSLFRPKGNMNRAMTAIATPFLDHFSRDLTSLAKRGYLELSVAREDEIEEIYRIVQTGTSSFVLVGLPGVGKDNIVDGLANRMAAEEVPDNLRDKRLVSLSLSRLVSESSASGKVEKNLIRIANEIVRAGNIILVIEDIHNIVGVTSLGTENVDLSEVLADLINKYNITVIGTTNPRDYTKYLENNALASNLLKIEAAEPDFNQTVQILEAKTFAVEYKYKVYFSYQALEKIVKLTSNYIHDKYQPLKSIKILEEVAVMVKEKKGPNHLVTKEDVAKIISDKIHMPLTEIKASESEKLMHLEELIHQRIVGQNEAVDMVASALRRARTELRDQDKPITNLLFLGPTGVGKTELAKTVAEIFFNSEDNMVRLDMSEYQQKTSLSRLIGIEGSSEGGVLTEAIRKRPFSLLLLDEIEKAHPDILNVFLQVMDDGRLTDSSGRTVDFSNCIIIATSNAAAFYLQDKIRAGISLEKIKEDLLQTELRANFRPEFLNRFNGIVLFKPLTPKEIEKITSLMLKKVAKRLDKKGINFQASTSAIKELASIGFSKEFGARPLARTIQQRVDDALADFLLTGKIGRRDKVVLEKGGEIHIEKARQL